jgi:hypothetical protein
MVKYLNAVPAVAFDIERRPRTLPAPKLNVVVVPVPESSPVYELFAPQPVFHDEVI